MRSIDQLRDLCRRAWGLDASLKPLSSECDEIYMVENADGRRFTLRLTGPSESPVATDFQTQALRHAAHADPGLPIPHLVADRDGRLAFRPDWCGDSMPTARLLTWLDGRPLAIAPRSLAQARSIGDALARLNVALARFDHPGADHDCPWDIRNAARMRPLLAYVEDQQHRAIAEAAAERFETSTAPRLATLRRQVVHNDLNPHNALVSEATPFLLTGIIDFGDMVRTALAADVAIAASYLIGSGGRAMHAPLALAHAFDRVLQLEAAERALIAPLMEARLLMVAVMAAWRASTSPENRAYLTRNAACAWHGLTVLSTRPMDSWSAQFLALEGSPVSTKAHW